MFRKIVLSTSLITAAMASLAQDVILKNNGEKEQVKIKEVGPKTITYKRWDNPDGPDFIVPKVEIKSIRYENGKEDLLYNGRSSKTVASVKADNNDYEKNILAIAPIWITNTGTVGLGISYERFIDKKNIFSLILPVAYSFNSNDNYNYSGNGNNRRSTMLWVYPGAKFYVGSRHEGKVSYAVGLSAIIGSGSVKENQYIYNSQTQVQQYTTLTNDVFLMGAMLHNSVNMQPSSRIYLGIEFGIGIPYFVNESLNNNLQTGGNYIYTPYSNDVPLVKFNFKVGYRF